MATYTNNYNLIKPAYDELADIAVINSNYDIIDNALNDAQSLGLNIGNQYNTLISYAVGDYCIYNNMLYKCIQATSGGAFDATKWQVIKVTDDLGNGGGSGSTVSWNQITQSGTKIAEVTIDGSQTNVYAPTSGGASNLSGLSDVNISSPTNNQGLIYDSSSSKWVNSNIATGDTVSVTQIVSSGTKIGTVSVNSSGTDLYAPTPIDVEANPSGTGSTNLTKLKVDNTIYNIPSGGSGGDSVSWNQITGSGTKIATITINNTPTDVYAPTSSGASALSGLSDVNLSTLSNGQALIYDSTNSKWINGTNGIEVEGNPSGGTSSGDLTRLKIGSTIYDVSNVEANPSSSASTTLNKIGIDGTVYSLPSGGGGSASALSDLSDVTVSNPSSGQELVYNGTNWENKTNVVYLTKAQYDALPSSKLTDDIQYFITDLNNVNDICWVDITGTLTAGQTSLTLQDSLITSNCTIDFYTDTYGVNPTAVSVSTGSVTLTFNAQQNDLGVKVRVWGETIQPIISGNSSVDYYVSGTTTVTDVTE